MASAEFMYANQDSADPFYLTNMKYGICRHCERFGDCPQDDTMPIVSHVSRYIMKYNSEIKQGFTSYPNQGNWEQQPAWFMRLLDSLRNKLSQLEQAAMKKDK